MFVGWQTPSGLWEVVPGVCDSGDMGPGLVKVQLSLAIANLPKLDLPAVWHLSRSANPPRCLNLLADEFRR